MRQKPRSTHSLVLMALLMMALVLSGNTASNELSFKHAHKHDGSRSDLVANAASVNKTASHNTRSGDDETMAVSNEAASSQGANSRGASAHCQHQMMSPQNAQHLSENSDNAATADSLPKANMTCCKGECSCPADHCFNFSSTALLQPSFETEILVARTAAITPILGQYSTLHFGQFRPPKSRLTA